MKRNYKFTTRTLTLDIPEDWDQVELDNESTDDPLSFVHKDSEGGALQISIVSIPGVALGYGAWEITETEKSDEKLTTKFFKLSRPDSIVLATYTFHNGNLNDAELSSAKDIINTIEVINS